MTDISLKRIPRNTAIIRINGTAPLIVHNWSHKAKAEMLAKQQGRKVPKAPKEPEADFLSSQYRLEDGRHGFPTMAFKNATVRGGARAFGKSVKMTELRQHLTFLPDGMDAGGLQLSELVAGDPRMREDMVRVQMTTDLRYRAEYWPWSVELRVEFLPSVIDVNSIAALIDAGGANGVGEWRPEKNGAFGTFEVADVD